MRNVINRYILPGLAFKAVVIGGGYATGRELVEFFLSSSPMGGLFAMLLATACWSLVCAVTFVFAFRIGATDYQSFFRGLLGRFDFIFELIYFPIMILVLSVFGSAAGAIGAATLGLPVIVGTLALMGAALCVCAAGQGTAEALFKYVFVLLYSVYAIFLVLGLWRFSPSILHGFNAPAPATGWIEGGITYASYNVLGAVLILPVLRHLRSDRDAIVSGLLAGPFAMLPAILFFVCLAGFYPAILNEPLPSDYMLNALGITPFHFLFQFMVFFALLECSVGFVQAINIRVDAYNQRRGRETTRAMRIIVPTVVLFGSMFVASTVGFVELIARGYRAMAYGVLIVFILPLFTVGLVRIMRLRRETPGVSCEPRSPRQHPDRRTV